METPKVSFEGLLSINHWAITGEHEPTLLKNSIPWNDYYIITQIMGDVLMNRLVSLQEFRV